MVYDIERQYDGSLAYFIDDGLPGVKFPTHRVICPRCDGRGVHDHPAFANGITRDEFDEDPDFREDYFSGMYDVPCSICHGRNVVDAIDYERLAPDLAAALDEYERDIAAMDAEVEAERRMGA